MHRRAPFLAAALAVLALTGCSGSSQNTGSATPTSERDAFCASWSGVQRAAADARQAFEDGNPLGLPGALQSLQSNLSQLSESVPSDAPAEVQRTLSDVGSTVSDAVSNVLSGSQDLEGLAREIEAIPNDLRRVGRYATSIC